MSNLNAMIDDYAAIKSQLADLETKKKAVEKALAELPQGAYESEHHRLTINDRLDKKPDEELKEAQKAAADAAVEAYRATLSRQYLAAHTVEANIRTHRIGARNGKKPRRMTREQILARLAQLEQLLKLLEDPTHKWQPSRSNVHEIRDYTSATARTRPRRRGE